MATNATNERERLRTLLKDTVTLLCKNSLVYQDELKIEGVIGITVDEKDVLLVHINEAFPTIKRPLSHQVMQPNISSTSGSSRSNTPIRSDASEHVESDDTCTSARSLPISQHRKLKRRHSVNRTLNHSFETKSRAQSTLVKTPNRSPAPEVEESQNEVEFNITTSPPGDQIVGVITSQVKEERLSDIIEEVHIKTEKPDDVQQLVTVEVADLKFVTPIRNTTTDELFQQECSGNCLTFPEEASGHQTNNRSKWSKEIKHKRLKTELNSPRDETNSDEEMNSIQNGNCPGSSLSWPSTSDGYQEDGVSRYPSCSLSSKSIKQCLQSELIMPLVNQQYWALAVRITWRNNPEQAWNQIVRTRQECDMTVGALDGVCFFLSAVTGLFRHSSTKGNLDEKPVYPGISYWVVFNGTEAVLDYEVLISSLNELDLGCEVKRLIPHGREQNLTDIASALYIGIKDHNNTCIRRKIDHSTKLCFGTAARKIPSTKLIVNSTKVKTLVKQAHRELIKANLESTLESWV